MCVPVGVFKESIVSDNFPISDGSLVSKVSNAEAPVSLCSSWSVMR